MDGSREPSGLILGHTIVLLLTFTFLTGIFFAGYHALFKPFEFKGSVYFEQITAEGSAIRRAAFLLLGLFALVGLVFKGRNRLAINGSLGWLVLFYVVWSFASLSWAIEPSLTFRRLAVFGIILLSALAIGKHFSVNDMLWFAFFGTALYLLIGLSTEIAFGVFQPFVTRFRGTVHPNVQALNTAIMLLAAVCLAVTGKRWRTFFLLSALVAFVFLILTQARTAFVAALIALTVLWSMKSSRSMQGALLLIIMWLFGLFFIVLGDDMISFATRGILLGRETVDVSTLAGRIPLWQQCLKYVSRRPFVGYGYSGFWTPRHIADISAMQHWGILGAHSAYLELLLDVGLIGLMSFLLVLALAIIRAIGYQKAYGDIGWTFYLILCIFFFAHSLLEMEILNPSLHTFLWWWGLVYLAFLQPCERGGNVGTRLSSQTIPSRLGATRNNSR